MGEYDLHIDIVGDDSSFSQTLRNVRDGMKKTRQAIEQTGMSVDQFFKGIRDKEKMLESVSVKIDLSNPMGELKKFDEQVVLMCENLDKYFEGLKGKLDSMVKVLGDGSTIAGNIKTNDDNIAQIHELQRANAELTAEIQRQRAAYEEQQSQLRKMADAVRQNNIPAFQQMGEQMDEAFKRIKTDEIRNSLKELSKSDEMARLMAKAVGDVEAYNAILDDLWQKIEAGDKSVSMKDIDEVEAKWGKAVKELEAAKKEYNELTDEQKKYVNELSNINGHHVRMRTQIMNVREELMRMIDAGKMGTPEFQQLAEHAGKLRRQMALANATMQYFADPNKNLKTLKVGLQGVAGAAGLVTGVMGVFNAENKKMAEIQTKVQSILAIIVGLETTYNLIKKTSNIMLAIEEVKTWALAKARGVQTAATTAATVAQEGLNTAMRANPIGAIISLLAILGTAIYAIVKALTSETEAEKKAREEKEAHIKAIKEQHELWAKSVAESASKQLISYRELQKKWDELGNDLKAKEKFIKDNQDAFKNLGFAVDSVSDAEKLLVTNTDAVVAAMMSRAKAAAYASQLQKAYEEQIERQYNKTVGNGGAVYKLQKNDKGQYGIGDISEQGNVTRDELKSVGAYTYGGLPVITDEQVNQIMEKRKAAAKKIADQLNKESSDRIKHIESNMQKEIDTEKKALQASGIKSYDANADKTQEKARKQAEDNAKADAEMREKLFELDMKERERQAKQRAATEEALANQAIAEESNAAKRELMQMEKDHKERLAAVDRQEEEFKKQAYEAAKQRWEVQNKGKAWADTDEAKAGWEAMKLTVEQEKQLSAQRAAINAEDARKQKEYMDNLVQQYQSYTDQRLKIDRKYADDVATINAAIAELRKKLATAGTDEERQAIEQQIEALTRSLGEAAKTRLKELSEEARRKLQDSPLFSLAWKDLQNVSTETLNMLIEKFKEVEGQFSGDPQAMKEWTERIQAMTDELVSRNPFKAMFEAREELDAVIEKGETAKKIIEETKKLIPLIEARISMKKADGFDTTEDEKQLADARNKLAQATADLGNAEVAASNARTKLDKSFDGSKRHVDELASAISALGNEIGGEAGRILNLIGNVMTFATSTAENMKKVAATGAQSISTMEKASVILTIISAAIQLAKQISELLPDTTSQYEKYRDKVNEVNKMEQAVRDYEMAVLEAKNAEKSWFASSSLNNLSNQWLVSSKASENYFKKLNELQATYQNESGSGWLTKLGAQANKTIASITGKVNELVGIEDTFLGNMQTKLAQFGWANAMGGQIGMNMYLENEIWGKGFDKNYVEGLTAAWRNLRIETRAASKGFLGTGVGGHSQRTEDLVQYVKKELGLDLFDKDGWLNQEAYEQVIEKYGDKLVGETKETLEALNELKEKHDEFLEQLHQFVNEMYSPIIQNFNDAMWEWYDEGTDALEAFQKAAGDTFRKIVSDLLDTQMLKLFGNEMSETITQLYTDYFDNGTISYGELMSGVTQAVDTASAKFVEAQPVLKATMLSVEESLSKMGIEMKSIGDTASGMFSDLSQAYRSMLLNMESDTKDFGDEVIRILTESLIDKFILGDEFEKKIEEITRKASDIMEATHVVVDADGNRELISSIDDEQIRVENSIAAMQAEVTRLKQGMMSSQKDLFAEHERQLEDLRKAFQEGKMSAEEYGRAWQQLESDYQSRYTTNAEIVKTEQEILDKENRIRELRQRVLDIQNAEVLSEEERKAALLGVQDELQREYELRQGLVKTMKDMMGLTMIERISATSLSNVGEELLSMLQDTSKSVDDWKDEIVKTMTDDLIKEVVYSDSYKKAIREYQEEYVKILGSDMDTADKQAALSDLADRMADFASDTAAAAGIIKQSSGSMESSFGDLHDSLMSSFLDMENGAKNFANTLQETLTKDLIDKFVFGQAFDMDINGKTEHFDNYDKYQENWTKRYLDALEKGDEALMRELTKEMAERQQEMAESAENYSKTASEAIGDTTFTDMEGNFVNALMDMEGSVEDFANDLKKTIVQKLVESFMVSEKIKPLLEDLQNTFDFAMGFNGATTEDRANIIAKGYTEDGTGVIHKGVNDIADELSPMQDVVKAIMTAIGYEVKEGGENASGEAASAFDNLGDTILSSLMNTESGVEDFMKSLNETIVNELVESYMATDQFKQELNDVKVGLKDTVDNVVRWEKAVKNAKTDEEFAYANEQLKVANQLLADAKQSAEAFYNSAAEGTEKYTKALKKVEVQQDTTFKDMADSLLDSVMDTTTAEDWAKELGLAMAKRIFEGMKMASGIQPLMDSVQTAFNNVVKNATNAEGVVDWTEVMNSQTLKDQIASVKVDFEGFQQAWKQVCEALGIEWQETLPFSDIGDTIIESLLDVEDDAGKMGERIARNLLNDMLREMVSSKYTEQMNEIRDMYRSIVAGEGLYSMNDLMNAIGALRNEIGKSPDEKGIIQAIQDLDKAIEDAQPDATFKGMADSWTSALMDMDATAADFGKDIGRTLMQKIVRELIVGKQLQKYLDDIQTAFDDAISEEGATAESVIAAVTPKIDAAVAATEKMKPVVDALGKSLYGMEEEAERAFGNLADSITSSLTDSEMTAEKFASSIAKTLTEQMIRQMLESQFADTIKGIQEDWAKALADNDQDAITDIKNRIVELYEAAGLATDELTKIFQTINDGVSSTPFDNLRSSLRSALMDMNGDAKDWSKSIAESLTEAFIDKFILGEEFDKRLAEWQDEYRRIMGDTLSPEERAKQLKELGKVISDAKEGYAKEAKAIHELMGTAEYGDQTATVNMADKATYDQFEMYLGIALSQQMCGEQQLNIQQQILATLQSMSVITSPNNNALVTQAAMANVHLQSIKEFSAEILNLVANIDSNISSLNGKI